MIAEDLNNLHYAAMGLVLLLLLARRTRAQVGGFFKALFAGRLFTGERAADRMFVAQHVQAKKKCPNCTEELMLSALICEACDYNFLSGIVGHGHKLLPAPEPQASEMPQRRFA